MLRSTVSVTLLLSTLSWTCSSDTTETTSSGGTAGASGATAPSDPATGGTGATPIPTGGTGATPGSTGGTGATPIPTGGMAGDPGESSDVFDGLHPVVLDDDLCFPFELPAADEDHVACTLVEVLWGSGACDCSQPGRGAVSEGTMTAIVDFEQQGGNCGTLDCDQVCGCAIEHLTGSDLQSCLHDAEPTTAQAGFCVIDVQSAGRGNPDLVAHCPGSAQRRIRVVGDSVPVENGVVYLDCRGE